MTEAGKAALWGAAFLLGAMVVAPILSAGTADPCEATMRIGLDKRLFGKDLSDLDGIAYYLAITAGTEAVRAHYGTFGCYWTFTKAAAANPVPREVATPARR